MPAAKRSSKPKKAKKSMAKKTEPAKALPVTLLSGFLGSGKTTLLSHILKADHGLRIAVIVNDIGEINVDANLIRTTHRVTQSQDKVIALQNGCICCTLRGDLLEELVRLAELAVFDYVVIESSGISEPEQVAETFDARLADTIAAMGEGPEGLDEATLKTLRRLKDAGGLQQFARLDTTVTVVDAFTLFHDFETADLISARRDNVTPEDERTVSDLMVDQIEFADVIVLNKVDMVSEEMKERMLDLIIKLNHRAKILETSHGRIDVKEILNTGMFNLELAQTSYGWLQDLHAMTVREVNGRKTVTPKPETEEYNVRNVVYVRRRPFSPRRLFELLHDKFILQHPFEEVEEEDSDEGEEDDQEVFAMDEDWEEISEPEDGQAVSSSSTHSHSSDVEGDNNSNADQASSATSAPSVNGDREDANMAHVCDIPETPDSDTVLANKRAHPILGRLFRSKGEFWLATRPGRAGEWSQAGAMLTLAGGRPWFCTIDESEYLTGVPDIDELVKHDIANGGEWGDRRQELVFIGEKLDHERISALLDECILNDEEWMAWQKIMRRKRLTIEQKEDRLAKLFDDGFPEWLDGDVHEGHDHS